MTNRHATERIRNASSRIKLHEYAEKLRTLPKWDDVELILQDSQTVLKLERDRGNLLADAVHTRVTTFLSEMNRLERYQMSDLEALADVLATLGEGEPLKGLTETDPQVTVTEVWGSDTASFEKLFVIKHRYLRVCVDEQTQQVKITVPKGWSVGQSN